MHRYWLAMKAYDPLQLRISYDDATTSLWKQGSFGADYFGLKHCGDGNRTAIFCLQKTWRWWLAIDLIERYIAMKSVFTLAFCGEESPDAPSGYFEINHCGY